MLEAPQPIDETKRLAALRALHILDTPPEERFDRLARLAVELFDVPIAYVALVDVNRQWFKASCGLDMSETPRSISFCGHTIVQGETLVIPDAAGDPRFFDNPLVTGPPHIRFYAGEPLFGPEGHAVGTFCIADHQPRTFEPGTMAALRDLAAITEAALSNVELVKLHTQLLAATDVIHQKSRENERLLLNILPASIAERLKQGEASIADAFAEVTILFADLVGFTALAGRTTSGDLVALLNTIFCAFDALALDHGVEKIKTIGDAYMGVSGLPEPRPDHAEAAVELARAMMQALDRFNAERGTALRLRIGLNTGPVVAGIIGSHKFVYDLWGDTVNVASRMESHGVPGRIQVGAATYARLRDRYAFEARGEIDVKGMGPMKTYLL